MPPHIWATLEYVAFCDGRRAHGPDLLQANMLTLASASRASRQGVLNSFGSTWRNLMAAALYLGLRKGELFALRKQDVDLEEQLLYVRRSHGSDTVKGKKALVLPIPTPLVQYLRDAIDHSPSDLVFPGHEGKRRPEYTAMEKVFRRVLARAGVVVGYRHICRRCAARREPKVTESK